MNILISSNNNNTSVSYWSDSKRDGQQHWPQHSPYFSLLLVTLRDALQHGRQSAAAAAPLPSFVTPRKLRTNLTSKAPYSEFPPREANYILSTKELEFTADPWILVHRIFSKTKAVPALPFHLLANRKQTCILVLDR